VLLSRAGSLIMKTGLIDRLLQVLIETISIDGNYLSEGEEEITPSRGGTLFGKEDFLEKRAGNVRTRTRNREKSEHGAFSLRKRAGLKGVSWGPERKFHSR